MDSLDLLTCFRDSLDYSLTSSVVGIIMIGATVTNEKIITVTDDGNAERAEAN